MKEDPVIFRNYVSIKHLLAGMFPENRNLYRSLKGLYVEGVLSAYRKAKADFCTGLEDDDSIRYWIYEFEMQEEVRKAFFQVLDKLELTPEEFIRLSLIEAIKDPERARKMHEEMMNHPEELPDIRLVRYYPVYKNETEAKARKRKIAEELKEEADEPDKRGAPEICRETDGTPAEGG